MRRWLYELVTGTFVLELLCSPQYLDVTFRQCQESHPVLAEWGDKAKVQALHKDLLQAVKPGFQPKVLSVLANCLVTAVAALGQLVVKLDDAQPEAHSPGSRQQGDSRQPQQAGSAAGPERGPEPGRVKIAVVAADSEDDEGDQESSASDASTSYNARWQEPRASLPEWQRSLSARLQPAAELCEELLLACAHLAALPAQQGTAASQARVRPRQGRGSAATARRAAADAAAPGSREAEAGSGPGRDMLSLLALRGQEAVRLLKETAEALWLAAAPLALAGSAEGQTQAQASNGRDAAEAGSSGADGGDEGQAALLEHARLWWQTHLVEASACDWARLAQFQRRSFEDIADCGNPHCFRMELPNSRAAHVTCRHCNVGFCSEECRRHASTHELHACAALGIEPYPSTFPHTDREREPWSDAQPNLPDIDDKYGPELQAFLDEHRLPHHRQQQERELDVLRHMTASVSELQQLQQMLAASKGQMSDEYRAMDDSGA